MTILGLIKELVEGLEGFTFCYDIRQMQNVAADDVTFPIVFFEEYYGGRFVNRYVWKREVTIELHFLDKVEMQGEAEGREHVREQLLMTGVIPFMEALNANGSMGQIKEYICDPEPPMFDANATGLLVRFTGLVPLCMLTTSDVENG